MQSKKMSLIESIANILIGYFVATGSQIVIFPLFDIHVSLHTNFIMAGFFTIISLCRSYAIRRYFNSREKDLSV